jgi:hypothetical protein
MYDSKKKEVFDKTFSKSYLNSHWWGGEPIWVTNELQNKKSAVIQWIGSEATIKNVKNIPFHETRENHTILNHSTEIKPTRTDLTKL